MTNVVELSNDELMYVDGGVGFEIMIGAKVFTGAAAFGIVGIAVVGLVGVGCLAWYVASQN